MGRRGTITALALGLALVVSACTADVVPSPLPPSPVATLPGPSYALVPIDPSSGLASVVVGGERRSLGKASPRRAGRRTATCSWRDWPGATASPTTSA